MERFRAHEKVFKTKKFSTKGLQRSGGSSDEDDENNSDFDGENQNGEEEDLAN
jgi:CCR4-NOT transcriptional regulation complex NOT5 subunit